MGGLRLLGIGRNSQALLGCQPAEKVQIIGNTDGKPIHWLADQRLRCKHEWKLRSWATKVNEISQQALVDAKGAEETEGNICYDTPKSARPLDMPMTLLTPPIGQRQEPRRRPPTWLYFKWRHAWFDFLRIAP